MVNKAKKNTLLIMSYKLAMQIKPKLESPQMQRSMEPLFDLRRATSLKKKNSNKRAKHSFGS